MRRSFKVLLLFLLSMVVLGVDAVSKGYVATHLPVVSSIASYPYGGIPVLSWSGIEFSITHAINHGAAWGWLSNWDALLIYIRLFIVAGLVTYTIFFNAETFRQAPLVLVITGAMGNIIDYFRFGHVIDLFHFRFWGHSFAIFNVADSAIFCGVVLLLLLPSLLTPAPQRDVSPSQKP